MKAKKTNMKLQWTKFIVVTILYLLFLYWVGTHCHSIHIRRLYIKEDTMAVVERC